MLESLGILSRTVDMVRARLAAPHPLEGIDVSHHQGNVDWETVTSGPNRFAYVRATQGVDFLDRKLSRNAQSLRSFPEFARGYYHFGTWWNARDTIKHDAETEAEFFYETCLAADPDAFSSGRLAPMLDVELTKKGSALGRQMSHTRVLAWVLSFCYRLDLLTGRPTGIYTGRYFLFGDPVRKSNGLGIHHVSLFADRPLWLAQYSRRAEPPKPIDGWPAAMWQFTGSGSCKGIRGRVDRNKFMGSTAEWLELLGYPKVRGLPSWGEVLAATRNS